MLQKFLSKYGLAAHLALLAAAPLALTPFLDAASLASVIFWLSWLAGVWFLTEPSIRIGEHLSLARRRVRGEMIRDPFFWFLIAAILFALFRMLNSGISLRYDPEQVIWVVGDSKFGGGPASAQNAGVVPFAVAIALLVLAMGIRHGIGLMARIVFGLSGAVFSGVGGCAAAGFACAGVKPFAGWLGSGLAEAPFWASTFGVWLIIAIVSGVQAEARRWSSARLPYVLGVAGNASALLFFAPPVIAVVWFAFAVMTLVVSLVYLGRVNSAGAVARNLSLAIFGFALPVFLMMMFVPETVRAAKVSALSPEFAFPESYKLAAGTLSRISRQIWVAHPWFGVGDGAFGLHVPFLAEKSDWLVIPVQSKFATSGYWTILAERGIIGCVIPAVGLGMLVVTYFIRLVGAFGYLRRQDDADIFPFAVPPVVWFAPLTVALLALEAVISPVFLNGTLFMTVLSALAVSAAAFPKAKKADAADVGADKTVSEN